MLLVRIVCKKRWHLEHMGGSFPLAEGSKWELAIWEPVLKRGKLFTDMCQGWWKHQIRAAKEPEAAEWDASKPRGSGVWAANEALNESGFMCEDKTANRKQGKDPDVTQGHGREQRLHKEQWEAQQKAQGTEQLYFHRLCGGCSPRKGMAVLFVTWDLSIFVRLSLVLVWVGWELEVGQVGWSIKEK